MKEKEFYLVNLSQSRSIYINKDIKLNYNQAHNLKNGDIIIISCQNNTIHNNISYCFEDNKNDAIFLLDLQENHSKNQHYNLETNIDIQENIKQIDENLKDNELLQCVICLELFQNCYAFVPCKHSFCEECCAQEVLKTKRCLQCSKQVKVAVKNEYINGIIKKYYDKYPQQKQQQIYQEQNNQNQFFNGEQIFDVKNYNPEQYEENSDISAEEEDEEQDF